MTTESDERLFEHFDANPPAEPALIVKCQAVLSFSLPDDYVRFLLRMNGGEGFVGKHYLMAWRVEDLISSNKECKVDDSVAALFLFGSDGGGEAFAFDTRSISPPIVIVPFIGMDFENAKSIAPSFNSFLQFLCRSDDLF
jgi:hypothetical protein